ncbi:hypothetical protein CBD41_01865 [bacterium TMED181]|nr:hypothetical protein [Planctomycetota bacterium]OUW46951.1 MAG: hypothetical protein CBD41_01865 [bacterium TMED181]
MTSGIKFELMEADRIACSEFNKNIVHEGFNEDRLGTVFRASLIAAPETVPRLSLPACWTKHRFTAWAKVVPPEWTNEKSEIVSGEGGELVPEGN